jgi:hypothetical protein
MSKTVKSWQKATASNKRLGVRISRTLARLQSRTVRRAFEAWYPRMLKEDDQEEEASKWRGRYACLQAFAYDQLLLGLSFVA